MLKNILKNSVVFCVLALVISACTTTDGSKSGRLRANAAYVDPQMAQACINAAANKYYLPTSVIRAVDAKTTDKGGTNVILQVDLRDAVCTISAAGRVQSIVDTSPKSADQVAAEERAAAKK